MSSYSHVKVDLIWGVGSDDDRKMNHTTITIYDSIADSWYSFFEQSKLMVKPQCADNLRK